MFAIHSGELSECKALATEVWNEEEKKAQLAVYSSYYILI